jgi:hypothetical protein
LVVCVLAVLRGEYPTARLDEEVRGKPDGPRRGRRDVVE